QGPLIFGLESLPGGMLLPVRATENVVKPEGFEAHHDPVLDLVWQARAGINEDARPFGARQEVVLSLARLGAFGFVGTGLDGSQLCPRRCQNAGAGRQ